MYNKNEDNITMCKIEYLKIRYNDRHRNPIRIQLKNEVTKLSEKTEDFHLTYV